MSKEAGHSNESFEGFTGTTFLQTFADTEATTHGQTFTELEHRVPQPTVHAQPVGPYPIAPTAVAAPAPTTVAAPAPTAVAAPAPTTVEAPAPTDVAAPAPTDVAAPAPIVVVITAPPVLPPVAPKTPSPSAKVEQPKPSPAEPEVKPEVEPEVKPEVKPEVNVQPLPELPSLPEVRLSAQGPSKGVKASSQPQGHPQAPSPGSDEHLHEEGEHDFRGLWFYAWTMVSVTFIMLVVPLAIFLLPFTPSSLARRSSPRPWRTVLPDDEAEARGAPLEPCDVRQALDEVQAVPDSSVTIAFKRDTATRQHRHLYCVFDSKYYRRSLPYAPKLIPYSYCSYIVFYSVALYEYGVYFKRPSLDPVLIQSLNSLKTAGTFIHGLKDQIPLLLTLGGESSDSRNISRALRSSFTRLTLVTMLGQFVHLYQMQGINLDWDHPTGRCGRTNDAENLAEFFKLLQQNKDGLHLPADLIVALTIPAKKTEAKSYAIDTYASLLDHIFVSTHKINLGRRIVGCPGRRQDTTNALKQIEGDLSKLAAKKLCYSISLGPDTFTARTAKLGVSSSGPATIGKYTLQPSKAGYYEVCKLTGVVSTGDPECSLRYELDEVAGKFLLATHVTPDNVRHRIQHSYVGGLADMCIVVFDMDLDDYMGACREHGRQMSPLTAALVSA